MLSAPFCFQTHLLIWHGGEFFGLVKISGAVPAVARVRADTRGGGEGDARGNTGGFEWRRGGLYGALVQCGPDPAARTVGPTAGT